MGREIRRVPLDFHWPLNKVWGGFINPHSPRKCPDCENGSTTDAEWLHAVTYLLGMLGSESRPDRPVHPWLAALPFAPRGLPKPTAALADLTSGLAGRRPSGLLGHDAIDQWSIQKAIIKAAGLPEDWGTCKTCGGNAYDPSDKATHDAMEAWKETPPPVGEGWQVWETVSDGSPVSPVFKDQSRLVEWLVKSGYSRAAAEAFTKDGWAPSMVMAGGAMKRDIESCDRGGK